MARSVLTLKVLGDAPATLEDKIFDAAGGDYRAVVSRLQRYLGGLGARAGKVYTRIDSSEATAASQTVTVDQSDFTAGDTLTVNVPGRGAFVLTAVASAPDATAGEFVAETSDDVTGDNLVTAITSMIGLQDLVTASNASGVVTITATEKGSVGNTYELTFTADSNTPWVLGGTTLAGGVDELDAPTATITITHDDVVEDDTVRVGAVTFTWKASPSGENEVDIGGDADADATNLAAKINAHSKLQGIVSASAASAVVTITYTGGGREAALLELRATKASGTTITNTITQASLVDDTDTLSIGNVTLTWKTTPSTENEVGIGSSDTEAGDNLAAKIAAHSVLGSLVGASNNAGVVTLAWLGDPSDGTLIGITEAGSGQVLSGSSFAQDDDSAFAFSATSLAPATTEAYQTDGAVYASGLA